MTRPPLPPTSPAPSNLQSRLWTEDPVNLEERKIEEKGEAELVKRGRKVERLGKTLQRKLKLDATIEGWKRRMDKEIKLIVEGQTIEGRLQFEDKVNG